MRYVVGGSLVIVGGLVVFGALTGRLPAMLAALVKPDDLDSPDSGASLRRRGGAVAGTGSTPDVPAPNLPANPKTLAGGPLDPSVGRPPIVAPAPAGA